MDAQVAHYFSTEYGVLSQSVVQQLLAVAFGGEAMESSRLTFLRLVRSVPVMISFAISGLPVEVRAYALFNKWTNFEQARRMTPLAPQQASWDCLSC